MGELYNNRGLYQLRPLACFYSGTVKVAPGSCRPEHDQLNQMLKFAVSLVSGSWRNLPGEIGSCLTLLHPVQEMFSTLFRKCSWHEYGQRQCAHHMTL